MNLTSLDVKPGTSSYQPQQTCGSMYSFYTYDEASIALPLDSHSSVETCLETFHAVYILLASQHPHVSRIGDTDSRIILQTANRTAVDINTFVLLNVCCKRELQSRCFRGTMPGTSLLIWYRRLSERHRRVSERPTIGKGVFSCFLFMPISTWPTPTIQ